MLRAAIDVGTNSVLVLLAEVQQQSGRKQLRTLWEAEALTRLGEGVSTTGLLKPEAVERTAEAVARFAQECRAAGAEQIVVVATSAAREAGNSNILAKRIEEKTGLTLRLLSGEEEARAAYRGARAGLARINGKCLVIDVGGGSTELVIGAEEPTFWTSLNVGSVRLSERFLHTDPYDRREWESVRSFVHETLRALQYKRPRDLVGLGVGGTITTLATLQLGLDRYDAKRIHGLELTTELIEEWSERLSRMTKEQRLALPGVPSLRGDVLPVGTLIFAETLRAFGLRSLLVSTFGIRQGILLE